MLFRLVHRVVEPGRLYFTTDAMAAAGAPPGCYRLGQSQVEVGPDQVVRQPGKTNFAGSALRPVDGVFRAARMLGRRWQEVWPFASLHPARFLGMGAALEVGSPADFCLVQEDEDGQGARVRVFAGGAVV